MKFQHLPIGTRFEFEGRVYIKSGPMTASADTGGQRMIPRYADLVPLDGVQMPRRETPASLDPVKVRQAFDAFYADALRRIDTSQHMALEQAKARFMTGLGLDWTA